MSRASSARCSRSSGACCRWRTTFCCIRGCGKLVSGSVAHPLASFMVGVCFGIFLIDLCFSIHLGAVVQKKKPPRSIKMYMTPSTCRSCGIKCSPAAASSELMSIRPLTERIDAFDEFTPQTGKYGKGEIRMLFWIFMLLFVLMSPLTMIYFGRRFSKARRSPSTRRSDTGRPCP